jgi:hypothetical protein
VRKYLLGQREGAGCPASAGLPPLPRLCSSNGNESLTENEAVRAFGSLPGEIVAPEIKAKVNLLQSNHRKTAALLAWTIFALANTYGIERLGMLTLTFADHVTDPKEATRRLKSLIAGVLNDRYLAWVRVFERQKSGRIHYHLIVVLKEDIKTGVDFRAVAAGDYRTAGAALRSEWAFWRNTAKLYRFGRTELLPIKSTAEAISRYVGKYITKHIDCREERDKGVRLAGFSKNARIGSTRFAWATPGSWVWRRKLKIIAASLGVHEIGQMTARFGPRWAYWLRDVVARFQLQEYPTYAAYVADGRTEFPEMEGSVDVRCSGVQPGRTTLGQAIGEAIMLLVKPQDRLEAAFGASTSKYRAGCAGWHEFQTSIRALVRSVVGPEVCRI